jgi:hypothetical protein
MSTIEYSAKTPTSEEVAKQKWKTQTEQPLELREERLSQPIFAHHARTSL